MHNFTQKCAKIRLGKQFFRAPSARTILFRNVQNYAQEMYSDLLNFVLKINLRCTQFYALCAETTPRKCTLIYRTLFSSIAFGAQKNMHNVQKMHLGNALVFRMYPHRRRVNKKYFLQIRVHFLSVFLHILHKIVRAEGELRTESSINQSAFPKCSFCTQCIKLSAPNVDF